MARPTTFTKSEPIVTKLLNGYEFAWLTDKDWDIKIKITNIYEHSRKTIDAEIEVMNWASHDIPIISGIRINLTSQAARNSVAKRLKEYPEHKNLDWAKMVDDVCAAAIILFKQGEPINELWTSEEISPPEYLINPILLKGIPTVIFGEKGVTKSTLSLLCYIILALPWHDNPFGLIAPTKSTKAIILDWESVGSITQWNAKKIQEGMDLPAFPLYHRRCNNTLADDIEGIHSMVKDLNAEVLIIDSLARAAGGDLAKDTENANRFFAALDKLNVTSLIIAQTSKSQEEKKKSIYGNALFTYYARSIFELCKSQEPDENEIDVALFHRWSNFTKLEKPIGFRFIYNGNKTKVERQPIDVHEFKTKIGGQIAVLDFLKSGPKHVTEIMEELGWEENSVRPLLSKLKSKGKVINLGGGKWGLSL